MFEKATLSVAVTEVRPQSDGSAECTVFFRLRLDLPSLAGPWVEVHPRVPDIGGTSLSEIETRAIDHAYTILARIVSAGPEELKQVAIRGKMEDLAEMTGQVS
jgi:hypothetical protein